MMNKTRICICIFFTCIVCLFGTYLCAFAEGYDGYIVKFKTPPVMALSDDNPIEPAVPEENLFKINSNDSEYISCLESDENVEYIEPNYIVSLPDYEVMPIGQEIEAASSDYYSGENGVEMSATAEFETPNDFYYKNQWNITLVNAPYLWKYSIAANSVKIGVVDSGNPSRHPDITCNIETGSDYTDTNVYDTIGHSTFVSGVIASDINNYMGTAGMLSSCTIIPFKIFNTSSSDSNTLKLYRAIYDAIHVYNCDVINLSLSMTVESASIKAVVEDALAHGIIVVAAAGNYNSSQILYPAGFDGVIGVGGVNKNKGRYSKSQYNESVDVAAPGETVYGTYISKTTSGSNTILNYTYVYGSGTSYAAPHVTAAAAVAKYFDPDITSDKFLKVIAETSERLGTVDAGGRNDQFGYGLLDMQRIVGIMDPSASPPPTSEPSATPMPEPSITPTSEPSATPMPEPSITPTAEPSATPIPEPSITPTAVPSATPMPEPSISPTAEPSATPMPEPSITPTAVPSATPVPEPDIFLGSFEPKLTVDANLKVTSISAKVSVKNNTSDRNVRIVMALYDDYKDEFCGAVITDGKLYGNSSSSFTLGSVTVPEDCTNPYVKIFVWDENLVPLIPAYIYQIKY
ncbi:MAG: S8 family serine peptidase [Clostridiales bacterium]|nr:S8 family serine peptidase [Clostridiales bacterium]